MIRHKCPHPYHQTKRQRKIESYTLAVVITGLVLFFMVGRFSVKSTEKQQAENNFLQVTVEKLSKVNEELSKVNKELLRQQDFIENSKKIDVQAQKDSRHSLTKLNNELSDVKKKLAFYQRVVAPETVAKGLYIDSLRINSTGEVGIHQYKLVVAQGVNPKRSIKGRYTLSVMGKTAGKEKAFAMQDILVSKKRTQGFSFRYYELLAGTLKFEQGFVPEQVTVTVIPSNKVGEKVSKQWFWREIVVNKN